MCVCCLNWLLGVLSLSQCASIYVCGREWRCSLITCVATTLVHPSVFVWTAELMMSLCSHRIHHTSAYWLDQSVLVEPLLLLLLLLLCACMCVRMYVRVCIVCEMAEYVCNFRGPLPFLPSSLQLLCGKMRPSLVPTMLLQHPHLPRTPPLLPHQSRLCPMQ